MGIFSKKKKGMFATPLAKVVQASKEENQIPLPLLRCITHIENVGMNMEGIYRVSGSYKQMADIQQLYDKGLDPDLTKYDRYVITGVIKKFFALLPEPVMTFKLYDPFLRAQAKRSERDRVIEIKKLVQQLPKEHFIVLNYIITHLKKISGEYDVTKMSVQNLAIVYGPTLFRSIDESPTKILCDSPLLSGAVANLITYHEYIFSGGELDLPEEEEEEEDGKLDISKVDFSMLESQFGSTDVDVSMSKFAKKQNSFFEKRRKKLKVHSDISEDTNEEELTDQIITDTVKEELKSEDVPISVIEENTKEEEEEEGMEGNEEKDENDLNDRKSVQYEKQENETKKLIMLEETQDEFEERLSKIEIDLKDPQPGVLERINIKRKKESRTEIFDQMSLEELKLEKILLKQELRHFEELFLEKNGIEPTNEDKNLLRPIYHRYRTVKGRIDKFQRSTSVFYPVVPKISNDSPEQRRRRKTLTSSSHSIISTTSDSTISKLLEQNDDVLTKYQELKHEKKEIQKKLLQFEKEFLEKNGRKVSKKTDREGMEEIYEKYSDIKTKITLMEYDMSQKNSTDI
eukprot:gene1559-12684_t